MEESPQETTSEDHLISGLDLYFTQSKCAERACGRPAASSVCCSHFNSHVPSNASLVKGTLVAAVWMGRRLLIDSIFFKDELWVLLYLMTSYGILWISKRSQLKKKVTTRLKTEAGLERTRPGYKASGFVYRVSSRQSRSSSLASFEAHLNPIATHLPRRKTSHDTPKSVLSHISTLARQQWLMLAQKWKSPSYTGLIPWLACAYSGFERIPV